MSVRYLTLQAVLWLVEDIGVGPVRDLGLLDSAVLRPQSSAFGEDAYPDLATKAAALMHSIARNHALVDGNKRLAWHSTTTFLHLNGFSSGLSEDDSIALVLDVATGRTDVPEIVKRLDVHE